jgi:hypothetical protein
MFKTTHSAISMALTLLALASCAASEGTPAFATVEVDAITVSDKLELRDMFQRFAAAEHLDFDELGEDYLNIGDRPWGLGLWQKPRASSGHVMALAQRPDKPVKIVYFPSADHTYDKALRQRLEVPIRARWKVTEVYQPADGSHQGP